MSRPEFRHAAWRTSSRSNANGNCVAVAFTGWRASTRSNGNCVEVAAAAALVGVRDSKDPAGPVLAVDPAGWAAFLAGIRRDEFG